MRLLAGVSLRVFYIFIFCFFENLVSLSGEIEVLEIFDIFLGISFCSNSINREKSQVACKQRIYLKSLESGKNIQLLVK